MLASGYKSIESDNYLLIQPEGLTVIDTVLPGKIIPDIRFPIKGLFVPKPREGTLLSGDTTSILQIGHSEPRTDRQFEGLFTRVQDCLSLHPEEQKDWQAFLTSESGQTATTQIEEQLGTSFAWEYPDVTGAQLADLYHRRNLGYLNSTTYDLAKPFLNSVRTPIDSARMLSTKFLDFVRSSQDNFGQWLKPIFVPLIEAGFDREKLWWYFNGPAAFLATLIFKAGNQIAGLSIGTNTIADAHCLVEICEVYNQHAFPREIYENDSEQPFDPLVNLNSGIEHAIKRAPEEEQPGLLLKKPGSSYGVTPNLHSTDHQRSQKNASFLAPWQLFAGTTHQNPTMYGLASMAFTDGLAGTRDATREEINPLSATQACRTLLEEEGTVKLFSQLNGNNPADDISVVMTGAERSGQTDPPWTPVKRMFKTTDESVIRFKQLTGLS